jgi:hypothetical protein
MTQILLAHDEPVDGRQEDRARTGTTAQGGSRRRGRRASAAGTAGSHGLTAFAEALSRAEDALTWTTAPDRGEEVERRERPFPHRRAARSMRPVFRHSLTKYTP